MSARGGETSAEILRGGDLNNDLNNPGSTGYAYQGSIAKAGRTLCGIYRKDEPTNL